MEPYITKYIKDGKPLSLEEYKQKGGFTGLKNALSKKPRQIIDEIKETGLRGKGGAYFPTGVKWEMAANQKSDIKYIICNADEGEPGTFKDKEFIYKCPFQIIEGMIICAYATGAMRGYIYIRGEYEEANSILKNAVESLKKENLLGENIFGSGFAFDIDIRTGAGSYVCGEETALIESIEGNRGIPRLKPPFPGESGLFGKPTVINNVETFANIPLIMEYGVDKYKSYGTPSLKGTKLISVSGIVNKKGVYEVPFGTPIKEIIFDICKGIKDGENIKFIQIGGLSGKCILPSDIDKVKIDIAALKELGLMLGSGAIYVAGETTEIEDFLLSAYGFFAHESCGRCTPCREGNRHLLNILEKMKNNRATKNDITRIKKIIDVMKTTSACGLGQAAPSALESLMGLFSSDFAVSEKGVH